MSTIIKLALFVVLHFISVSLFAQQLDTPLENSGFQKLTSYNEMLQFVESAVQINKGLNVEYIGKSLESRKIPMISIYYKGSGKKLKVLLLAQQRGDAPSGKEALLMFLKFLALEKNQPFLKNIDLHIIPQINPDGAEKNTLENASKTDLYNNHFLVTEPETKVLHAVFDKIMPDIVLDLEEYNPYKDTLTSKLIKNIDIQLGTINSTNIQGTVLKYAQVKAISAIKAYLTQKGFSGNDFVKQCVEKNNNVCRNSPDINDFCQSAGVLNTYAFFSESKKSRTPIANIESRTKSQLAVVLGLFDYVNQNKEAMYNIITEARKFQAVSFEGEKVTIRMKQAKAGTAYQMQMYSLKNKKDTTINYPDFYSELKSVKSVLKPTAYLVPKKDTALVNFIKNHNFSYYPNGAVNVAKLRQYEITALVNDSLDERNFKMPEVNLMEFTGTFNASEYLFVPINQTKAKIIEIAFEPESLYGLVKYEKFDYLLKQKYFPILRVER